MSEQKMPALPEPDVLIAGFLPMYRTAALKRIRAEAIEFGRQQERERLEPLRVAVEGSVATLDRILQYSTDDISAAIAGEALEALEAASTLLEQTE